MRTDTVHIAIVGHTNTGKTSLLRTLTRDSHLGDVSDRPATTRDVQGTELLVGTQAALALYDTPGLEDAMGVAEEIAGQRPPAVDPVAAIEHFVAGNHGHGRYEQEAKVLRQLLRSDAALYVIDAREPIRAKHREELRLLASCGRPLLPVLNFIATTDTYSDGWKQQLRRLGLHVQADFDTVAYDHRAERQLFEKLASLLEARRGNFMQLLQERTSQRAALIDAACRAIAELLTDAAAARIQGELGVQTETLKRQLRERVATAEQACVDELLRLFRFDLTAYHPPVLPLSKGRWALDPMDPEALRSYGIRTGSAAVAGGMAGLAVDAMTGFTSLGAAAALGAGIGAAWNTAGTYGRPWLDRWRGHQQLVVDEATLALLTTRQLHLLRALLRRGHASTAPVSAPEQSSGWPTPELRHATMRCRAHPQWSALNIGADDAHADRALRPLSAALKAALADSAGA